MPYIPGSLLALLGGSRLLQKHLAKEDRKWYNDVPSMRHLLDVTGWESNFNEFWKNNRQYNEYQALKKFFTPERLECALEQAKKREESNKYWAEETKKRYTIDRIYAYDYEAFVFALFAPLATYNEYEKKWDFSMMVHTSEGMKYKTIHLPEDYVIHRIALEYGLSKEDAIKRFEEFKKRGLIDHNHIAHWCELGIVLSMYANIVSANDMNITKWIEQNGKSMTDEQLLEEAEPYKHQSPDEEKEKGSFI